ncbi:MAG: hypothetical protein Q8Q09_09160 [Deltaproteobacteria bacterium]|nr:hypothetical protein [Deltaproteobacteria bacterium]
MQTHTLTLALVLVGTAQCGTRDNLARLYAPEAAVTTDAMYPVTIHAPPSLRGLQTNLRGPNGEPLDVPCASCHSTQQFALPQSAQQLGGPHVAMQFAHGSNQCRSCHDPDHYDRLRLATGTSIPMTEAMQLCAQCHGPQFRDYNRGAHGGMNGHWDLRRGPRLRNHCVDCHDPHAPAFPHFTPMPAPRDLPVHHSSHEGASHGG